MPAVRVVANTLVLRPSPNAHALTWFSSVHSVSRSRRSNVKLHGASGLPVGARLAGGAAPLATGGAPPPSPLELLLLLLAFARPWVRAAAAGIGPQGGGRHQRVWALLLI